MADVGSIAEVDERLAARLAMVASDTTRFEIVSECNLREVSPRGFREAFGGPSLAKLQQIFIELEQFGWIQRVPMLSGPPPEEFDRLYRSDRGILIEDPVWVRLPQSIKSSLTLRIAETIQKRMREGMKAATIDARNDSHLSVTPLLLDREGWDMAIGRLGELLADIRAEQERARERLAETGEEPILMTVGLLGFESPRH